MRKFIVIAVALVVVSIPTVAGAEQVRSHVVLFPLGLIKSDGTVSYFFPGFVVSAVSAERLKARCMSGRKVEVFRDEAGGDQRVGADRTNRFGEFNGARIWDLDQVPGDYYAKVKDKVIPRGKHKGKLRCLAARSVMVTVQAPHF